ncbi:purine-binding chemotaxis protein CheW [Bacillus niacini]|uniref:Purine-binding chemotaxis protein CheW n=1 Tax=Neobacillus niacini TaxID=86668 RepID=A0A852THK0_9BACI|nr:chemotaxis protein CheW [Neobacillus niacini]NYE06738.1 purine-binding chemotaxis protein CheW [Neobacillus niacini]
MKAEDCKSLVFRVGSEEYSIHITQVVSIERMQEITSFPNRPPHVVGFTSVRHMVIPVIDMRAALIGNNKGADETSRIIIVMVKDQEIGLIVDAATDVIDILPESIQQPDLMLQAKETSYLKGVSKLESRIIILLDIEKLLENTTNLDELKKIKDSL